MRIMRGGEGSLFYRKNVALFFYRSRSQKYSKSRRNRENPQKGRKSPKREKKEEKEEVTRSLKIEKREEIPKKVKK